jgi:hypothetical protein
LTEPSSGPLTAVQLGAIEAEPRSELAFGLYLDVARQVAVRCGASVVAPHLRRINLAAQPRA